MQSPVKGGGTLVLKDSAGKVIATGATVKTPGTESCDWTTPLSSVPASDFYTIETNDGEVLGTIAGATVEDGELIIEISYDGSASIR